MLLFCFCRLSPQLIPITNYGLVYPWVELVSKLLTIYVQNEISLLCVFHVQVVSGSLDPEFEETFEFQVPREEFSSRYVQK